MRICLLGIENLPVLAREYAGHGVGGAQVQQTLLARALARAGHDVTMVVGDYGQQEGAAWDGVRTLKAFVPEAGVPVMRFLHPRATGMWRALQRADADVYYTSCAGMQVGLLAMFCRWFDKRFVFRAASDTDCDPSQLLVRYARDKWLYGFGLQRADAILVQNRAQAESLKRHYGLSSRIVPSLVDEVSEPPANRDIDVLWVGNLRKVKRPGYLLEIAAALPEHRIDMVGGSVPGEEALYDDIERRAAMLPNVVFHGRLPYHETCDLYARSKLLVNTSEFEGFPNTYLQAWARGVPVVGSIDPDGIIERHGLGAYAETPEDLAVLARWLLADTMAREACGRRCTSYMTRYHDTSASLVPYLETFEAVCDRNRSHPHYEELQKANHA